MTRREPWLSRPHVSLASSGHGGGSPPTLAPARTRISVSVESPWAARAVMHAVKETGALPVPVPWKAVTAEQSSGSAALVYDLCPWTLAAEERLAGFAEGAPGVPILLYLPPNGAAFTAYSRAAHHPQIGVQVQSRDAGSLECLRQATAGLIRSIPRVRIMEHVKQLLPGMGSSAYLFGHRSLSILGSGRRPQVSEIARALGLSTRTLQRRFKDDGLPQPKSLLDWLTVMHLNCVAETRDQSVASIACELGLSANDLYRLRRRAPRWLHPAGLRR